MTADIFDARQRACSPWLVAELFRREPLFAGAALCLAALAGPTLFAMALDQRTVLGINVWVKPLRFEVALAVYLATLAWFAGWLPRSVVTARWYRIYCCGRRPGHCRRNDLDRRRCGLRRRLAFQ